MRVYYRRLVGTITGKGHVRVFVDEEIDAEGYNSCVQLPI